MGNFKEDIARTEAFVFDVDGVFTDGNIMPLPTAISARLQCQGRYAVSYAVRQGYKIFIVTGAAATFFTNVSAISASPSCMSTYPIR